MSETMAAAALTGITALAASFITALAALGVVRFQSKRQERSTSDAALAGAAHVVLNKGLAMASRAQAWSRLAYGQGTLDGTLAALLRLRTPVDPMRMLESLIQDAEAIHFAGSQIAVGADQATVAHCNQVISAADALAAALQPRKRPGRVGTLSQMVQGPLPPHPATAEAASKALMEARSAFANHLRRTSGRPEIDVYAVPPS